MKVTIEISEAGAAMESDRDHEIGRMLAQATKVLTDGFLSEGESAPLHDSNGNRRGWVTLSLKGDSKMNPDYDYDFPPDNNWQPEWTPEPMSVAIIGILSFMVGFALCYLIFVPA